MLLFPFKRQQAGARPMKSFPFKIRTKLFISYSFTFLLILIVFGLCIFYFVRLAIERNIESELEQTTNTLLSIVETATEVSLKNYLRATAEKNLEIAQYYHQLASRGELSEEEAKRQVAEIFLHQHLGQSGYIYAINSAGVLQVHPESSLVGLNISSYAFVGDQKLRKNGYLDYDWKNPGEDHKRGKALYMSYFAPWDWIISVSTYRSEFRQLVNINDFKEKILALSFGKTGYSFLMDPKGNLVIHPQLEGHNIFQEKDAQGRFFIQDICSRKIGKIIYPWQNPGESKARQKLVIFNYIPEFQWIVASSSYLDEFFAPLDTVRRFMIGAMVTALLLLLPLTLIISRTITAPLQELMSHFSMQPSGDFTPRITREYSGEIGMLAGYFNQFMERLEQYSNDLKKEIGVRTQAEIALRQSEEMFSKAFSLSPIGIMILNYPGGQIISVNDSFVKATGYKRDVLLNRSLLRLGILSSTNDLMMLQHELALNKHIRERAMVFRTRNHEKRQALVSADLIDLWGNTYVLVIMEDVTERQQLQERILDIGEKERRKIGQDIHDDLCPHLIGTEVMSKILLRKLEDENSGTVQLVKKIRTLMKEAISKSRVMARGLCPVFLVDRGLEAAIEELAANTKEVYNLTCSYEGRGHLSFEDSTDTIHIFMIVQEAVSNSVRHAQADTITIRQESVEGQVQIVVEDNGIGISAQHEATGMGLKIMRYRAERIGAKLTVEPCDHKGTRIIVTLHGVTIEDDNNV
ncbi:MAG: PAS domain S-box-containing protein [Desulforhopalus sp.]|jgi:PAS domain S-box-containing protein